MPYLARSFSDFAGYNLLNMDYVDTYRRAYQVQARYHLRVRVLERVLPGLMMHEVRHARVVFRDPLSTIPRNVRGFLMEDGRRWGIATLDQILEDAWQSPVPSVCLDNLPGYGVIQRPPTAPMMGRPQVHFREISWAQVSIDRPYTVVGPAGAICTEDVLARVKRSMIVQKWQKAGISFKNLRPVCRRLAELDCKELWRNENSVHTILGLAILEAKYPPSPGPHPPSEDLQVVAPGGPGGGEVPYMAFCGPSGNKSFSDGTFTAPQDVLSVSLGKAQEDDLA